jgi:hypothetical protein
MIIRLVVVAAIAAVAVAALWQNQRYLRIRRDIVGDRQPILYSGEAFHALTFVKVGAGKPVVDEIRALRAAIEVPDGGLVVYAGQVGAVAVESAQLSSDWSGLVLTQYPSREAYDRFSSNPAYRHAVAGFERSYTHGVVRPVAMNLLVHQGLLLVRLADVVRRVPSAFPFVPAGDDASPKQKIKIKEMEQLDGLRSLGEDAIVIFNLIKPGSAEQQSADRSYTLKMMGGMAEGGYGPMHMGRAVTLEGHAEFEQFAAVYYPGIDFVQAMVGSTFMGQIGRDKQLGDSLAVVTVPIPLD